LSGQEEAHAVELGNHHHVPDPAGRAGLQIDPHEMTYAFWQGFGIGGWLGWIGAEEPATLFEASRLAAVGEEAEVTDADKGRGKHVKEEPAPPRSSPPPRRQQSSDRQKSPSSLESTTPIH
jgi:hypothetical protein